MARKDSTGPTAQSQQDAASDGIAGFELPKSIITKIAKSAIPENAKLQKDTVLALVKGSTVFINYLAATAQDVATQRSHKTISAADVLKALELIDFGDMIPGLQTELEAYRATQKADPKPKPKPKPAPKEKPAAPEPAAASTSKGKAKETAAPARSSARTRAKKQQVQTEEEAPAAPPAAAAGEDVDMAEDEEIAKYDEEEEEEVENDELDDDEEEEEEEEEAPLDTNGMQVDEDAAVVGKDLDDAGSNDDD